MSSAILLDTGNLYYATGKRFPGQKIDYAKYVQHVDETFGDIKLKMAYVSDVNEGSAAFSAYLMGLGFTVISKEPRRKKVFGKTCYSTCWICELTAETLYNCYIRKPQIDHLILGSSNIDLLPLIQIAPVHVIAAGVPKIFTKYAKSTTELSGNWLHATTKET